MGRLGGWEQQWINARICGKASVLVSFLVLSVVTLSLMSLFKHHRLRKVLAGVFQ